MLKIASLRLLGSLTLLLCVRCSSPLLPDPSLTPQEVVAIHLDALQKNDVPEQDHGISLVWNFSSPQHKENMGPLERFKIMVHNENYRPLLNSRRYEVRVHFQEKSKAEFFVLLEDKEGLVYSYLIGLSLQEYPPYEGCWMIDAVIPMDLPGHRQPKVASIEVFLKCVLDVSEKLRAQTNFVNLL